MKRTVIIFIALLLCVSGFAQKHRYVVGFYNLENLFDIYDDPEKNDEDFLPEGKNNWTADKYEKKISNMAQVIRAMKEENKAWHTILGVSEVENRLVLEDLVKHEDIAAAGFSIVHYDSPDNRGVDVALLYLPDSFEYIDSESVPFTFGDSAVEISLDKEEQAGFRTRDILMVHGLIEGEHFAFYVAHLPSRLGGKGGDLRSRGAEIIYGHARGMEKKYPGIKIVVMGDMNDNPTDESMAVWMKGKAELRDVKPGDYFSPFINVLDAGYGSLEYRGTWNIYDIILANYNLAKAPKGGLKICRTEKKGYYGKVFCKPFMVQQSGRYKGTPFRTFSSGTFIGGYSDHYPTYIIIGR